MQCVHTPDELLRAVAAQSDTRTVIHYASFSHAVCVLGALYMAAMIAQARRAHPEHPFVLWCDCGDRPSQVMEALRVGLTHLVADLPEEVFVKLEDIASQYGAHLTRAPLQLPEPSAR